MHTLLSNELKALKAVLAEKLQCLFYLNPFLFLVISSLENQIKDLSMQLDTANVTIADKSAVISTQEDQLADVSRQMEAKDSYLEQQVSMITQRQEEAEHQADLVRQELSDVNESKSALEHELVEQMKRSGLYLLRKMEIKSLMLWNRFEPFTE